MFIHNRLWFRLCPTCVGVAPKDKKVLTCSCALPHMRGGCSDYINRVLSIWRFAPHAWGLLRGDRMTRLEKILCPTCVGVALTNYNTLFFLHALPHMRGGCSIVTFTEQFPVTFAPHAWGLLLLQLFRGIDLLTLPHMRGGCSAICREAPGYNDFAPHAWGLL